jgi:hypothetical protein
VLTAILGATAARGELIVLLPAALTAIGLAAVLGQESLRKEARRHWLLVLATGATTVYAVLQTPEVPDFRGFVEQLLWHAGALDLAVGVLPFVGAVVAAYAFFRAGFRSTHIEFAAVALSVTGWLWVAVAVASADASAPHLLHERYLISLVPLFVTALVATARLPEESPWPRVSLLAAVPAALLPLAIPFGRALDLSTVIDTLSLQPFARFDANELRAAEHASLFALLTCAFFAVAYGVARRISTRALVLLTLVAFVSIDLQAKAHIRSASEIARATVPWHRDWVDSAAEGRDVALVADDVPAGVPTKSALTAFFNTSIVEVYTACDHTLGEGFGEQHVTVEPTGGLVTSTGPVRVTYAVVPWSWEFRGDVIATNQRGGQVLVRPVGGLLHAAPAGSGSESCAKASP